MTTDTERGAWLEERRRGVGSSDAAVIAGLSPWKTLHELYLEKKGILPEGPMSPEMEWGLRLEPAVAEAYRDKRGFGVAPPATKIVWSQEHPFLFASLDRVAVDGRIVELKTSQTREGWGEAGTDEVPEQYLVQVQHQMLVTGIHRADIAALIHGSDFRVYPITFSETIANRLVEMASDFWSQIIMNTPPPLDYTHPSSLDLVRRIYGVDGNLEIELRGDDLAAAAAEYVHLGEEIKDFEKLRDSAKVELLAAMKEAALGQTDNGYRLKRRLCVRRGYTVKDCEFVMFKVHGDPK